MSEIRQGLLDAAIAPGRILFRHANDEQLDLFSDAGAAKVTPLLATVKLVDNQTLIPAHEGIGRRDCRSVFELLAAERMGQLGEATAFGVGQAESTVWELGGEHANFCLLVGNHLLLVAIDPARDHGDDDVEYHGGSSGW